MSENVEPFSYEAAFYPQRRETELSVDGVVTADGAMRYAVQSKRVRVVFMGTITGERMTPSQVIACDTVTFRNDGSVVLGNGTAMVASFANGAWGSIQEEIGEGL